MGDSRDCIENIVTIEFVRSAIALASVYFEIILSS